MPREIGAERVRRRKAGTFANQDEAEACSEIEADGIADSHPALLHHGEWANSPTCGKELREKVREQGNSVALDRQCGQAVGDDDGEVGGVVWGGGVKFGKRVRVEGPSKNRLAEIRSTIGGVGLELKDGNGGFSEDREFVVKPLNKGGKVEQGMHSVARLSMGELKAKYLSRRDAMTGRRQRYSGRSEIAQAKPGSQG